MLKIIIGILISYLLGSIPTAYIFGRILKGIDIRKHGSGNVGATNALRVLGKVPGIICLLLDIFKGIVPVVFIAPIIFHNYSQIPLEALRIIFGLVCIAGHNWTVFLQFKGGKGVATSLGVFIGLCLSVPGLKIVLLVVVLIWLLVFVVSRIVSLASILSAVFLPVLVIFFCRQSPLLIVLSFLLAFLLIYRHKSNLKRLINGTEPRTKIK